MVQLLLGLHDLPVLLIVMFIRQLCRPVVFGQANS
jgi:hypothetical protein